MVLSIYHEVLIRSHAPFKTFPVQFLGKEMHTFWILDPKAATRTVIAKKKHWISENVLRKRQTPITRNHFYKLVERANFERSAFERKILISPSLPLPPPLSLPLSVPGMQIPRRQIDCARMLILGASSWSTTTIRKAIMAPASHVYASLRPGRTLAL